MMKRLLVAAFVLSLSNGVIGQNASATLDAAARAMGTTNLTSIMYSGTGSIFNLGQAVSATAPWPRLVLKNYAADITYAVPAMRLVTYRTTPEGGVPFGGNLQVQFVSGADAWNLANTEDAPQPGRGGPGGPGGGPGAGPGAPGGAPGGPGAAGGGGQGGRAGAPGGAAGGPPLADGQRGQGAPPAGGPPAPGAAAGGAPPAGRPGGAPGGGGGGGGRGGPQGIVQSAATAGDRRLQIWLTAPGFIKAAQANNATVTTQGGNKLIAFTADGQKFTGVLDAQNLLTKTTTWVDNPVLGDTAIETTYTGYQTFEGVKFPTHIVQMQGGYPVLDLNVFQVKPNQAVAVNVPANVRAAAQTPAPPAAPAQSQKLADGVWLLPTSHNSLVVEFADHVVVIEGPLNEARSDYVIAETHRLVPNKPIRYLINTHQHFDHSGGVRTFAAEGATIVTAAMYKPYYERVFALPRTINPDKLAKSGKKAVIEGVTGKRVLMDSTHTIELYVLQGNAHNAGMLVAYLPKEKILVNADLFTPPPANPPAAANAAPAAAPAPAAPAAPDPNAVNLYDNIQRLKLDVVQIVPIHGAPGPYATLPRAIGKSS